MSVPATINRQINNLQQEHFDAINCRPENVQCFFFLGQHTSIYRTDHPPPPPPPLTKKIEYRNDRHRTLKLSFFNRVMER